MDYRKTIATMTVETAKQVQGHEIISELRNQASRTFIDGTADNKMKLAMIANIYLIWHAAQVGGWDRVEELINRIVSENIPTNPRMN